MTSSEVLDLARLEARIASLENVADCQAETIRKAIQVKESLEADIARLTAALRRESEALAAAKYAASELQLSLIREQEHSAGLLERIEVIRRQLQESERERANASVDVAFRCAERDNAQSEADALRLRLKDALLALETANEASLSCDSGSQTAHDAA